MFGWSRSDTVYPLDAPDLGTENVRPTVASVTEKDKLWSGLLAAFANNVSVVGIKYFVDANAYVLRRLLWLCLVLIGVGLLFYQVLIKLLVRRRLHSQLRAFQKSWLWRASR